MFFSIAQKAITAELSSDENILKIREGAFAKVMVRDEISTLTADIDDEVTFINTQDMYVYETNAIPENTIFYGEIEDVREPVEGKDGALKISIYKMITPDKKVYKITGHIYSENDNYIGGKNTSPAYYHKVAHYSSKIKPILQAAPLNIYEMGKHTVIKPGAELFVVFDKDVILK
ncbi:MAG: hypothetical protein LUH11_04405 [Candidatus Gastranaerophilales bacterium]|nr:hypothetical protein [Candidatus Gastranaerophilales bacterium]